MATLALPTLRCRGCGERWNPRRPERPKVCPRCKRRDWDSTRAARARRKTGAAAGRPSPSARFKALAAEWKRDTEHVSSLPRMVLHPAYQQIIGMGRAALPFLLEELETQPDWWFPALFAVTGADPVPPESRGDLDAMAAAWLRWGRTHGGSRA